MNKYTIAVCTPDAFRPSAKALISDLKKTNLAHTDLIILDNGYEHDFRHAEAMNAVLEYTRDNWVVFLDDDVRIDQSDWLVRLVDTADRLHADVVGCVHTYRTGEVNHAGILVHADASTELLREFGPDATYVPALSSALIALNASSGLRFDTNFGKYQHDIDICMSAWQRGLKVAIDPRVSVVHEIAGYYSTIGQPALALKRDAEFFARKWQTYARNDLYALPPLQEYAALAESKNWSAAYNDASALKHREPKESANGFAHIAHACPHAHLRAGALFHLYELSGDIQHLRSCLAINPLHSKARALLDENDAGDPRSGTTPEQRAV